MDPAGERIFTRQTNVGPRVHRRDILAAITGIDVETGQIPVLIPGPDPIFSIPFCILLNRFTHLFLLLLWFYKILVFAQYPVVQSNFGINKSGVLLALFLSQSPQRT